MYNARLLNTSIQQKSIAGRSSASPPGKNKMSVTSVNGFGEYKYKGMNTGVVLKSRGKALPAEQVSILPPVSRGGSVQQRTSESKQRTSESKQRNETPLQQQQQQIDTYINVSPIGVPQLNKEVQPSPSIKNFIASLTMAKTPKMKGREKQSTNFDISSQGLSDSMEGTTSGQGPPLQKNHKKILMQKMKK